VNRSEDAASDSGLIGRIHAFWFGDTGGDAPPGARNEIWFRGGPELDRALRARFGDAVERALSGEFDHWRQSAAGSLAFVLLLDQFTRNIFRGSPRAYQGDERALGAARLALARGFDMPLQPIERVFLYLPFEHAENLADQDRSVALFGQLVRAAEPARRDELQGFLRHAREHREIVRRFGRFPHRNEVLGRVSTAAEREFLAAGAPRYGQRVAPGKDRNGAPARMEYDVGSSGRTPRE